MKQLDDRSWKLDTLLVHSSKLSRTARNSGKPTVQPIYTSTTYLHTSADALDQALTGVFLSGGPCIVLDPRGIPIPMTPEEFMAMPRGVPGAVFFCLFLSPFTVP